MEGQGAAGGEGERGTCGEGARPGVVCGARARSGSAAVRPPQGSPPSCGCRVCSAAASAAEQVRKAGVEQPRAGRVANKPSPLRPDREKGVKN